MNLSSILNNIKFIKVLNEEDVIINNVVADTRKVRESDIFVGIKGEKIDGNELFLEHLKMVQGLQ